MSIQVLEAGTLLLEWHYEDLGRLHESTPGVNRTRDYNVVFRQCLDPDVCLDGYVSTHLEFYHRFDIDQEELRLLYDLTGFEAAWMELASVALDSPTRSKEKNLGHNCRQLLFNQDHSPW